MAKQLASDRSKAQYGRNLTDENTQRYIHELTLQCTRTSQKKGRFEVGSR